MGPVPFICIFLSARRDCLESSWEISAEFWPRKYLSDCYLGLEELKLMPSVSPGYRLIGKHQAIPLGRRKVSNQEHTFCCRGKHFKTRWPRDREKHLPIFQICRGRQEDCGTANPLSSISYVRWGKGVRKRTHRKRWGDVAREGVEVKDSTACPHRASACCPHQEAVVKCVSVIYVDWCGCPERRKGMLFSRSSSTNLVKMYFVAYICASFLFASKASFYRSISNAFFFPPWEIPLPTLPWGGSQHWFYLIFLVPHLPHILLSAQFLISNFKLWLMAFI